MPDAYRVPAAAATAELREKGSRFLAVVRPVADEPAARHELGALTRRYSDATHHCWAWRLGAEGVERSSDAGEPAGTAGVPILQAVRGVNVSDVLVVVVRWFGGTKLGKGGVARAYSAAAAAALREAGSKRRLSTVRLTVELPYEKLGAVRRLLRPPEVELADESYGAAARLTLRVWRRRRRALGEALADLGLDAVEGSSRGGRGAP